MDVCKGGYGRRNLVLCSDIYIYIHIHTYIHTYVHTYIHTYISGFGGLKVPKFAGSNPAEAVGFFRAKKNPQHVLLWKGSKAVCPMS